MSNSALAKIWTFFALATLTLSVSFFLRTTGTSPTAGEIFGFLGYKPVSVAIFGLPIDLGMLCIVIWLQREWIRNASSAGTWATRIPYFYFEAKDIDAASRLGRIYQGWSLFLSLIVPMCLALVMYSKFLSGSVYVTTKDEAGKDKAVAVVSAITQQFELPRLWAKSALQYGEAGGPQYFALEPWIFTGFLIFIGSWFMVTLFSILKEPTEAPRFQQADEEVTG